MSVYLVVIAVGFGSYLLRNSMRVLTAWTGAVPPLIERAARYEIPVSFAALATDTFASHIALARTAIAPAVALVARDRRNAANTLAPCRDHRGPARTVARHGTHSNLSSTPRQTQTRKELPCASRARSPRSRWPRRSAGP